MTKTPAHIRVISYEPALGPIDLLNLKGDAGSYFQILEPITGCGDSDRGRIDWVIAGGESGHSARPAHLDWFRAVRDQCATAGVSFFFKQMGQWKPAGLHSSGDKGDFAIVHPDGEPRRDKSLSTAICFIRRWYSYGEIKRQIWKLPRRCAAS